jgi:hypothetical protein
MTGKSILPQYSGVNKTDEAPGDYITDVNEMIGKGYENAAEIHPPKKINAIREKGLEEYTVWGWVKISATFIHHIRKLKGAKLAIWQVISLSIDENGECKLSIQDIADLAGYSYSETHASLKELDGMGYLSIDKENGRKSMYSPNFAARGKNQPNDDPSRKARGIDDQPLQSTGGHPSSPPIENAHPSIKELKEINIYTDEDFATVSNAIATLQGGGLKSGSADLFDTWLEIHSVEWILKAVALAKAQDATSKHNSSYVDGILRGWERDGYPAPRKTPNQKTKNTGDPSGTPLERYIKQMEAEGIR